MKKLFFIFILIFVTGCTDYQELNKLSYITAIGFDYVDDMYIVTYEVMDNQKEGDSVETNTYVVTGSGSTTYEAHVNAASKLNKTAYYLHAQVIVVTNNILNDKLLDVIDSVIRNPKLNEEFLLVVSEQNTPEEIFNTTTDAWPSTSFYIYSLISDNEYSKNFLINMPFVVFAEKVSTENIDPIVSKIKIQDDEIISDGAILISDNATAGEISIEESNIFNVLIDDSAFIALYVGYGDTEVEVSTSISNISYSVTEDNIEINIEAYSEIKKSSSDINLYDDAIYSEISTLISESLKEKIGNFITTLQSTNCDALGFSNYYYISTRNENDDLWQDAQVTILVSSSISRKGIIYNVD